MYTPKDATRFWSKVDRRNPDECWYWQAGKNSDGYGSFSVKHKTLKSHKVAYTLSKGEPNGLHVLHTCDNRACCNPAHLFLGTNKDNVADRESKGRGVRLKGSSHGMSKLSFEQVKEIRERYKAGGISQQKLAKAYSVDQRNIWSIVHNITRKDC